MLKCFHETAQQTPDKVFLCDEHGRVVTYGESVVLVTAIAELLPTSESVALVAANTIEFVLFFIAVLYRAVDVVVLGSSDTLEPALFTVPSRHNEVYTPEKYDSLVQQAYDATRGRGPLVGVARSAKASRIALFTSGTLGSKKLAVFSVGTVASRALSWGRNFAVGPTDRFLCTSTFAHSHGLNIHLIPALIHGASLAVIDLRLMTVPKLVELFGAAKPTIFTALPSLFELLLTRRAAIDLARARLVLAGSERLSSNLLQRAELYFGITIVDQFGCVETGPLCLLEHRDGQRFIGPPLFGKSIRYSETERAGIFRIVARSDVMADQIVGTDVTLAPSELTMDDRVQVTPSGMALLAREASTGTGLASLEEQLEQAVAGLQCLVLPIDGALNDVLVVNSKAASAVRPEELKTHSATIRTAYEVNALPRTNSGKKLRTLRNLSEPIVVSGIRDATECQAWLETHFRLVPQYDGSLHHRVTPKADNPAAFTSSATSSAASFHNDAYDYAAVPSLIALYCVRPADSGGTTYVSDVATALNRLPGEVVEFFRKKSFWFQTAPARYYKTANAGFYGPVISANDIRFSVGYLSENVDSERELDYLEQFFRALDSSKVGFQLEAKQLLLLNNRRMMHARSAFSGSRELFRFWVA